MKGGRKKEDTINLWPNSDLRVSKEVSVNLRWGNIIDTLGVYGNLQVFMTREWICWALNKWIQQEISAKTRQWTNESRNIILIQAILRAVLNIYLKGIGKSQINEILSLYSV
jgi:hypothetical protein